MVDAWKGQINCLVDAYLDLQKDGPIVSDETTPPGMSHHFALTHVYGAEYGPRYFTHATDAKRTNETLLRHGYIGSIPEKVTLTFPLQLFEVYRQIHRVCPRFSMGALSTSLTNLHHHPRRSSLAEQLMMAYDAYLEIMRQVEARAHLALGRDAAWYIQNVCAPCLYKIRNEAPLRFSWLGCMDGNNSLKLVDATFRPGTVRPDDRASTSFRWLTPEQVDVFKDEVANSQKQARKKKATTTTPAASSTSTSTTPVASSSDISASSSTSASAPATVASFSTLFPDGAAPNEGSPVASRQEDLCDDTDDDVAWLNINELTLEDTEDITKCLDTCVERWKAPSPEARRKCSHSLQLQEFS
ncbi:hypothetical protein B0H14DRAFT_2575920 [Mycena olivaceomarginata]|nr:hypothetical protein B0H14DRAFT_2575920 [Mycena olivaceomarginata]